MGYARAVNEISPNFTIFEECPYCLIVSLLTVKSDHYCCKVNCWPVTLRVFANQTNWLLSKQASQFQVDYPNSREISSQLYWRSPKSSIVDSVSTLSSSLLLGKWSQHQTISTSRMHLMKHPLGNACSMQPVVLTIMWSSVKFSLSYPCWPTVTIR